MSIQYKLLKDDNINNVQDSYFITDLNNNNIIFKSYVDSEDNIQKFIKNLKEFIKTKLSPEDIEIANKNIIRFYIDQFNDQNQIFSFDGATIIPHMNIGMMIHWNLDNKQVITMEGGSRKKNRKNITGGNYTGGYSTGEYSCPNLIPDPEQDRILYDIYINKESIKTETEAGLMLEYVEKYHKELELYYAIKQFGKITLEQISQIFLSIEHDDKLKYFIKDFSSLKKI